MNENLHCFELLSLSVIQNQGYAIEYSLDTCISLFELFVYDGFLVKL